jgi:pimeloyl-ACP methyl ester carboxylesterase
MKSKRARTDVLEIAYEEHGPEDGAPVILLHGFPYDARTFDEVAPALAAEGCRVLVPYLRGYGPTRFLSAATPRSGEQAALGHDLLQFMDALGIARAALAGYDWGGRAACIAAALRPERVRCLLSCTGYNIQNIAASGEPATAEQEHRMWYQYYFHTERGRAGLAMKRRDVCRLLWKLWSPEWSFDEATFEKSAASFDNPDFVEVVIQSYRHRFGYAPGDPALTGIDAELARQPVITVPAINLHGGHDGVSPVPERDGQAKFFTASYERRVLPRIGHNVPQEAPAATLAALRDLMKGTSQ